MEEQYYKLQHGHHLKFYRQNNSSLVPILFHSSRNLFKFFSNFIVSYDFYISFLTIWRDSEDTHENRLRVAVAFS